MKQLTAETIRLVGGTLCLDFVNTIEWGGRGTPLPESPFDVLAAPAGLVSWGGRLGLLAKGAEVDATPDDVAAALALRATIHATFASITAGDGPSSDALSKLRAVYAQATAEATIREHASSWRLTWSEHVVDSIRFAVAADSISLLGDSNRVGRVRLCPGPHCGGLFLDASGRRRWCSMDGCGSRAKMRRRYERQRAAANKRGRGP
jgi:predicted RNA-binding Zn ribbon-like protein